jgi:hypothetical protein
MSLEVDYLPVATAVGNNADSQANFQGSGYQLNGFTNGIAQPFQANKIWRQCSMVAAAVANFISNQLNIAVIDDGNLASLITNFTNAVLAAATGSANRLVSVAFTPTPVFDASQGSTFEIVLTGNVTSSTLINLTPGQRLLFIIKQDGSGGHTFAAPGALPLATIDTDPSITNIQAFIVDSGSNVYATTPLTAQ